MEDQNFTQPPIPPQQENYADNIPPLKPGNWLWQSILATVFCCIPFGIVGIVYAAKVDSLYFNGMYAESERAAQKAKMWTLIAFG
ncbi:MAG: CD225/dispanin family protein, partial [Proteiniphilum sp.]|nr:CD225/dispanin family protein [Proteiniphilum sp.]